MKDIDNGERFVYYDGRLAHMAIIIDGKLLLRSKNEDLSEDERRMLHEMEVQRS